MKWTETYVNILLGDNKLVGDDKEIMEKLRHTFSDLRSHKDEDILHAIKTWKARQ